MTDHKRNMAKANKARLNDRVRETLRFKFCCISIGYVYIHSSMEEQASIFFVS